MQQRIDVLLLVQEKRRDNLGLEEGSTGVQLQNERKNERKVRYAQKSRIEKMTVKIEK